MQSQVEAVAPQTSVSAVARAHDRLLRSSDLQFDRSGFKPPEVPGWLLWLREALEAIAPLLKWVFWIGAAALAAFVLYAIGRELLRLRAPRARAERAQPAEVGEWRPDVAAARDLLQSADALAAEGRFAEAVRLLLLRSVEDIQKRQPGSLRVSLTAREIAGLKALPEAARPAFVRISRVVERSLFGEASVVREEFVACRRDYEAFALPEGWRA